MPRRVPLPDELHGTAIRTSDGEAHEVGRGRLRSSDVAHPFHGTSAVGLDLDSVVGACRAFEPVLRADNHFSHSTAAALWGVPLPASVGVLPLHVASVGIRTQPRRNGVVGHVLLPTCGVSIVLGFPVVSAAETWFQLASLLSREDLVAAGDYLVSGVRGVGGNRSEPLCSVEQLQTIALRHRGHPGAKAAGWALPRLRTGVDSRMESLLRLLLVAGRVSEPIVGLAVPVDNGRQTLHPDLALPERRAVFEYEGDEHRTDRRRFRADIRRRELFEAAGWRVIRVTADDIFAFPEEFLERVRGILRLRDHETAEMVVPGGR